MTIFEKNLAWVFTILSYQNNVWTVHNRPTSGRDFKKSTNHRILSWTRNQTNGFQIWPRSGRDWRHWHRDLCSARPRNAESQGPHIRAYTAATYIPKRVHQHTHTRALLPVMLMCLRAHATCGVLYLYSFQLWERFYGWTRSGTADLELSTAPGDVRYYTIGRRTFESIHIGRLRLRTT